MKNCYAFLYVNFCRTPKVLNCKYGFISTSDIVENCGWIAFGVTTIVAAMITRDPKNHDIAVELKAATANCFLKSWNLDPFPLC